MNVLADLEMRHEEELYSTIADTQARDWKPVLRQKRSFDIVNRIVSTQWDHVNKLITSVNLDERYGKERQTTLSEVKDLIYPILRIVQSGKLPPSNELLAVTLVYDVATGDLRYCLSCYRRVLTGQINMLGLRKETSDLFDTFEDRRKYENHKKRKGHTCNETRAQVAAVYLDTAEPLLLSADSETDPAILYGGHRNAVKKRLIDQKGFLTKQLARDLNTESPEFFKRRSYWGMITTLLEEDLMRLAKKPISVPNSISRFDPRYA